MFESKQGKSKQKRINELCNKANTIPNSAEKSNPNGKKCKDLEEFQAINAKLASKFLPLKQNDFKKVKSWPIEEIFQFFETSLDGMEDFIFHVNSNLGHFEDKNLKNKIQDAIHSFLNNYIITFNLLHAFFTSSDAFNETKYTNAGTKTELHLKTIMSITLRYKERAYVTNKILNIKLNGSGVAIGNAVVDWYNDTSSNSQLSILEQEIGKKMPKSISESIPILSGITRELIEQLNVEKPNIGSLINACLKMIIYFRDYAIPKLDGDTYNDFVTIFSDASQILMDQIGIVVKEDNPGSMKSEILPPLRKLSDILKSQ